MILVPILRPDQGKHVVLDLQIVCASLVAGKEVRVVICDLEGQYCPVHDYNGNASLRQCGTCRGSIEILRDVFRGISGRFGKRLEVVWLSELDKSAKTDRDFSEYNADISTDIANELKRSFEKGPENSAYEDLDSFLLPPYLSESLSNTGLTLADLDSSQAGLDRANTTLEDRIGLNRWLSRKIARLFTPLLNGIDCVYLFNGRMTAQKTLLKSCRKAGIPVFVHEVGFMPDTFTIYPGYSLDEHVPLQPKSHFKRSLGLTTPVANSIGPALKEHLLGKLSSSTRNHSFYGEQELLRMNFRQHARPDKQIISLFLSSSDEISSIFPFDQSEYERALVKHFIRRISTGYFSRDFHVYVRFHPRSARQLELSERHAGVFFRFYKTLNELSNTSDSVTILGPRDSCNSYALLKDTHVAVSMFSVISAEASWLVPVTVSHILSRASDFTHENIYALDPEEGANALLEIIEKEIANKDSDHFQTLRRRGRYLANSYAETIKRCSFSDYTNQQFDVHSVEHTRSTLSRVERICSSVPRDKFIHANLFG